LVMLGSFLRLLIGLVKEVSLSLSVGFKFILMLLDMFLAGERMW